MNASVHRCFDRKTLANFQVGKLSAEKSNMIALELEHCESCRSLAEGLDNQADFVVSTLRGLRRRLGEAGGLSSTIARDDSHDSFSTMTDASNSAGPVLPPPREFGQYLLEEQIGQGGYGTVWKATHRRLRRRAALKLLSQQHLSNENAVRRFSQEMEAIGRLSHENLVLAHDAGEIEGQPFLAMELLEGCDLSTLIRRTGPLSVCEAGEVIRQAALGLGYAHQHGSIHRDVKPSNLMITSSGAVKILDLGLARLLHAEQEEGAMTRQNELLGTLDYMSPEQSQNASGVDGRSDIYSLGCTLFYALAGRAPYADLPAKGIIERALAHSTRPTPKLSDVVPDVPVEVSDLTLRMMAKSAADRPENMEQVAGEAAGFSRGGRSALISRVTGKPAPQTEEIADQETLPATDASVLAASKMPIWISAAAGSLLLLVLLIWMFSGDGTPAETGPPSAKEQDASPSAAATATAAALEKLELPEELKTAMQTVVRQHSGETSWGGKSGDLLFAISAEPLPAGEARFRMLPAITSKARLQATSQLLQTKSLLQRYEAAGLADASTLRQAFFRLAGDHRFTGNVAGLVAREKPQDGQVIALAYAKNEDIDSSLVTEASTEMAKAAYRDVMHEDSRRLMKNKQWEDALLLWRHLHQRQLVSPEMYLDAATCFLALKQEKDALRMVDESLTTYADIANWSFFEKAAGLAEQIEGDEAEKVVAKAYELALEKFEIPNTEQ